jgi:hypothetical protein
MPETARATPICALCGVAGPHTTFPIFCVRLRVSRRPACRERESEALWDVSLCPKCEVEAFEDRIAEKVKECWEGSALTFFWGAMLAGISLAGIAANRVPPGQSYERWSNSGFDLLCFAALLGAVVLIMSFFISLPELFGSLWRKSSFARHHTFPDGLRPELYCWVASKIRASLLGDGKRYYGIYRLPGESARRAGVYKTGWLEEPASARGRDPRFRK